MLAWHRFTNDALFVALTSWLGNWHRYTDSNNRYSQAGPSSRASYPPSSRWPTPPLRSRLSPLHEDAVKTFAADDSAAMDAWDPNSRNASVERALKIRTCSDLASLLNTVPDYYRGVLSKIGSDLYSALDSLDSLLRRKATWKKLAEKEEVPFHYNPMLKIPHVDFPKGAAAQYKEHFTLPAQSALKATAKNLFEMERKALDQAVIDLQARVELRALIPVAWEAVEQKWKNRPSMELWKVVIPTDGDWPMDLNPEPNADKHKLLEKSQVDYLKREKEALQKDLEVYLPKMMELKYDLIDRAHRRDGKKTEKKRKIDEVAKDVASSALPEVSGSINSEVQRQVAALEKRLKSTLSPSPSKVARIRRGSMLNPTHSVFLGPEAQEEQTEAEGAEKGTEEGHCGQRQGGTPRVLFYGQAEEEQEEEERTPFWRRARASTAWQERESKRKGESLVEAVKGQSWTFGKYRTYPDEILSLPPSEQVSVLLSRAPVALLDANRFRSSVHVQPGLVVPLNIQHDLSASLKFMFETKIDKTLISKAYSDWMRRTRWKWEFLGSNADKYDPDYDVDRLLPLDKQKKKQPPLAAPHIERGLRAGADYVRQIVESLPDGDSVTRPPVPINVKRAQEFMVSNNLIVTSTDKNLGVAVFKREWIKQQGDILFGDQENYFPLTPTEALEYLNDYAKTIIELCEDHLEDEKQLSRFMCHNMPSSESERSDWTEWAPFVPEAYAIPKIHKNPWKGRPICPGYSLPQNPASKFCAKAFRPYIESRSWVIQGSKDFVMKLADVNIPNPEKTYIVSADVVAFYPSIDCPTLAQSLFQYVREDLVPVEVENGITSHTRVENRINLYERMIKVALAGPIMTYMDQILLQHKGLPMGAAGSPDMANMFGLHYEEQWMQHLADDECVLFFGRYLDDIYTLVEADSPDEALYRVKSVVQYGDVKLLWEEPSDKVNFLDLTTEIRGNRIYHEPFVKAMSHRERIPWSSAHPKDVKKGTFSSEISRLATLCSDYDVYAQQCEEAVNLYIGRGYPKGLVTSWLKSQKEKRWADRVTPKVAEEPTPTFFTLKTHFNEAWKGFNVHELESRIIAQWRQVDTVPSGSRNTGTDAEERPKKRARIPAKIGLSGVEYSGQSRLQVTAQDDGTDLAVASGQTRAQREAGIWYKNLQESRWTQQWCDTGRFLVSRRKNTQLWDVTRGWNRSVWNNFMANSGMLRPFDPMYEGLIIPDEESFQD